MALLRLGQLQLEMMERVAVSEWHHVHNWRVLPFYRTMLMFPTMWKQRHLAMLLTKITFTATAGDQFFLDHMVIKMRDQAN